MALNDTYEPSGKYEDAILEYLKEERRLGPTDIANGIGAERAAINHHLHRLNAAGWIRKPHGRGLYEFVNDPRDMDDDEIAAIHLEHALDLLGFDGIDAQQLIDRLHETVAS